MLGVRTNIVLLLKNTHLLLNITSVSALANSSSQSLWHSDVHYSSLAHALALLKNDKQEKKKSPGKRERSRGSKS